MARKKQTSSATGVPPATFAWYYSSSRIRSKPDTVTASSPAPRSMHKLAVAVVAVLLTVTLAGVWPAVRTFREKTAGGAPVSTTTTQANQCEKNTLSRFVLVSISKRHLWACDDSTTVYESAVVTGMERYVADRTPLGTYHVYAKQTNLHLTGVDSTGSWNDYVHYWLPFLNNQYGQYGFHDATWRKPGEFGNISPNSRNASHGCVELPLGTARWLYSWVSVGATVKVER